MANNYSKYAFKGMKLQRWFAKGLENLSRVAPDFVYAELHVKQVRKRNGAVKYVQKQPCDFVVIAGGRMWGIDTKECAANKWYPSRAPQHQREELTKIRRNGGKGVFVVWFKRFGHSAIRVISNFDVPATPDSGVPFAWEMFLQSSDIMGKCPMCNLYGITEKTETILFHYGETLGSTAEIKVDVPVLSCSKCGFEYTDYRADEIKSKAIVEYLGK